MFTNMIQHNVLAVVAKLSVLIPLAAKKLFIISDKQVQLAS